MLVLTRKTGSGILIGDDIYVSILGVKGTHVKVGINAPKGKNIIRDELINIDNKKLQEGIKDE